MAWLAVDEDGAEYVYDTRPERNCTAEIWKIPYTCEDACVELPRGSIEKLIGRKLTWEDDPVEI